MELLPALFLLALWLCGVPVRFLAGCIAAALVLDGCVNRRLGKAALPRYLSVSALVILWSAIVFAVGIFRYWSGDQGIDFAIFTQVMQRFADGAGLTTSLVAVGWVDFITHHLAPILIVPGLMVRLGGGVQVVAIALHAVALGLALVAIAKIGCAKRVSATLTAIVVLLIILHPSFRNPVLWEVHDEIYAAPFLIFAILALEARRVTRALILLGLATLCKESMFIVASLLCAGALIGDSFAGSGPLYTKRQKVALGIGSVVAVVGFVTYSIILPRIAFQPTFDFSSRFASFEQLLSLGLWQKKMWWAGTMFAAPILLMLSLYRSGPIRCNSPRAVGAAIGGLLFFTGAVALTSFQSMINPYTYYQVLPVLLIGVLIISLIPRKVSHRPALVAAALCLCFCFGSSRGPVSPLLEAHQLRRDIKEVEAAIPGDAVVIASDWDAAWLVGDRHVMRAFHANRNLVKFDYIVERKSRRPRLSLYLRSWSRPCLENLNFTVRCALPSVAVNKISARKIFMAQHEIVARQAL